MESCPKLYNRIGMGVQKLQEICYGRTRVERMRIEGVKRRKKMERVLVI
jgi:hypothetical protein